jgi:DNA-binding transcriptional LysR family regulator
MRAIDYFHLKGVDFPQLVALHAIVAEESVSRAAERLGVTQSAMSHTLKKLRALLDDDILVRGEKGLEATSGARAVAKDVGDILSQVQSSILTRAAYDPKTDVTEFHISMSDNAEASLGADLSRIVMTRAPAARIRFSSVSRGEAIDGVMNRRLDCAVGVFSRTPPGILSSGLFVEGFACLSRPNDPAPPTTLKRLLSRPHILASSHDDFSGRADVILRRLGHQRRVCVSTSHFLSIAFHVANSHAVALAPERLARRAAAQMGLTLSKPPVDVGRYEEKLLWRQGSEKDPRLDFLLQSVREAALATNDPH